MYLFFGRDSDTMTIHADRLPMYISRGLREQQVYTRHGAGIVKHRKVNRGRGVQLELYSVDNMAYNVQLQYYYLRSFITFYLQFPGDWSPITRKFEPENDGTSTYTRRERRRARASTGDGHTQPRDKSSSMCMMHMHIRSWRSLCVL